MPQTQANTPLKSIVSTFISITDSEISCTNTTITQQEGELLPKTSTYFVDILKNTIIKKEDLLVSFDVVNLFTRIPVLDAIDLTEQKYHPPEHILILIKHSQQHKFCIG